MVPLGLGTDTGGSVRLPVACCGIVGLKTGRGAVPTQGVYPLAASFDTVGPLATTVADCALAYAVLTATEVPEPALDGLRVGVLTAHPALGPADAELPCSARRARAGARRSTAGAGRGRARARAAGARGRHVGGVLRRDRRGPRGDVPEPARGVRAADPGQARPRHHGDRRAGAGGPPGARRVARRGRPGARRRPRARADAGLRGAAARRRRRARRAAAVLGLHARLQLPRLAGDRDGDRCSSPAATHGSSSPRRWHWSATAGCVSVDPCARPASPT